MNPRQYKERFLKFMKNHVLVEDYLQEISKDSSLIFMEELRKPKQNRHTVNNSFSGTDYSI